jgi:hypothetical protein
MANEDKIRVISDLPVLSGPSTILHVQLLSGPSEANKPTDGIANGSLYLETDTGLISVYDEDDGWGTAQ